MVDSVNNLHLSMLSKGASDHRPLLLELAVNSYNGPKPFRFLDMWVSHHTLEGTIRSFWEDNKTFNGMSGLGQKLKALRSILTKWSKEEFGHVFHNLKEAESNAKRAQDSFEANPNPESLVEFNKANAQLLLLSKRETEFWRQKSSIKWLKEGDASTKFFHNVVKNRRQKIHISSIKDELGKIYEGDNNIASHAITYYTNIYSPEPVCDDNLLFSYIPNLIGEEDNNMICTIPLEEEIRGAVWDLNANSAPGPDGYNGTFFKTFWHIIRDEVGRATQEFFLGLPIPKSYGATLLTLIPKVENPKTLGDFRPISLSTFLSKINTKILANRLGCLLHKLISPEQSGFQAGKGVDENILLTQEMIHCLDNASGNANIAIKVDFAKAFDRISWEFLEKVLSSFGFSHQSSKLLLSTLKATFFSILINGSPHGFFRMMRGVKQGDPLSPLLFIIGNEGLSRLIKAKIQEGFLKTISTGRNRPPSHLAYADDIIFFLNGHFRNLLRFKGLLDCFLKASGHLINLNKSHFYTGSKVKPDIKSNMRRALKMEEGKLPFVYLGATIGKGKIKKEDCMKIILHFDAYLNTWHSKVLNQMGRLILIKHVLSSIPLHIVAVQQMPKSVHNLLNKKMQNFLWGYIDGRPKYHWKSWRSLCYPKYEGGLGIRHLEDVEAAYSAKIWWKIRNSHGIWGDYMRSKYRPASFQECPTDTVTWKRAARIHTWAIQHVHNTDDAETWEGEPFTTKIAYHSWRESKPTSLVSKMIELTYSYPTDWEAYSGLGMDSLTKEMANS
ncbi:unnamed protein product [Cuscuta campestris]|uniref:Reverse transcriptase domain-containing protein n=1 Tax=Cuscuta campestris TaxID=132261 RepID=A0A484LI48_9ASTE|nr:unnamed protein product [Cuscuta campestris]